jgi:hypothetical protein
MIEERPKWHLLPGVRLFTEIWFAWRASHELLDSYKRMRLEDTQLAGRALYERIVIRRSGLDAQAVTGILRRAEQSFCEWPSERELTFRDVVQYIAIEEFLRSHAATGTHTNLVKVVEYVIPGDL